jgi:hypothetical protein
MYVCIYLYVCTCVLTHIRMYVCTCIRMCAHVRHFSATPLRLSLLLSTGSPQGESLNPWRIDTCDPYPLSSTYPGSAFGHTATYPYPLSSTYPGSAFGHFATLRSSTSGKPILGVHDTFFSALPLPDYAGLFHPGVFLMLS